MCKWKKLVMVSLALVIAFTVNVPVCYANTVSQIETRAVSRQVIARYNISATDCKKAYNKMTGYNSWTADIAAAVVGCISMPTGAIQLSPDGYKKPIIIVRNRLFIQGGKAEMVV